MKKRNVGKYTGTIFAVAFLLSSTVRAVELNNWRQPYYRAAAEMELVKSSPSGMFWDDCPLTPLFDSELAGDPTLANNHWWFEPAATLGVTGPHDSGTGTVPGRLEVLNDLRYRNLLVRQTLNVDSRYKDDPLYPAKTDRFALGRIEEAYAQLDWQYGFVRFGRLLRNWGPFADRSLILSANPYSYDALEWQVHSSLFEFRQMFAAFPVNPNPAFAGTADNLAGRYFAAHALNLMLGKWVTVGVDETMLFHRQNGFPDLQYVNPFSI